MAGKKVTSPAAETVATTSDDVKPSPEQKLLPPADPAGLTVDEIDAGIAQIQIQIAALRSQVVVGFSEVITSTPKDAQSNANSTSPHPNNTTPTSSSTTQAEPSENENGNSSNSTTNIQSIGSSGSKRISAPAAPTSTPPQEKEEKEENKNNEEPEIDQSIWRPPPNSIPIRADVRKFDFAKLGKTQVELTGRKFDVIMTDPPWQLATSNPTRGVAIGYQQLADNIITDLPIKDLQDDGFIFIWVINAKYGLAHQLLDEWGYTLVDEITWVKQTVNRRLAKSHGFYLQHAKETCLVGKKGKDPPRMSGNKLKDVIFAERRGQSQKPTKIYEMIEEFVPGGTYLEIFGRRNNLRDYWCTIGNEL